MNPGGPGGSFDMGVSPATRLALGAAAAIVRHEKKRREREQGSDGK